MFSYFERERESSGGTERERERGRERILIRLHIVSAEPDMGLNPTNHEIMS